METADKSIQDNSEELTPELQQELLNQIQASMFKKTGSKYMEARMIARWHRSFSSKARARNKKRRNTARASRKYNYARAKSK